MSHFPATVRSTAHCGRGSAVSTSVVTRCSIVISMREALASLAVSPGRSEIRTQPLRSLALGAAKVRFYLVPDLMPHLAAAASSVTHFGIIEPRGRPCTASPSATTS